MELFKKNCKNDWRQYFNLNKYEKREAQFKY